MTPERATQAYEHLGGEARQEASRLARGASITFAARTAGLLIGVVSSIILARALGAAGRGTYALVALIPVLFQFLGGLGLEQAVVYLVARQRSEARGIALTLAAASLALGILLAGAYAVLDMLPAYRAYLQAAHAEPGLVWMLIALLPAVLASQCLISAFLGLEDYRSYNLLTLTAPGATLTAMLVIVTAGTLDVQAAVVAIIIGQVVALAAALWRFLATVPGASTPRPAAIRAGTRYGAQIYAANLAWFAHYRADIFLVSYLAGPVPLGFYATAVGLAEKVYMAPSSVGTVLFPAIATAGAERARELTPLACRHTLWVTLALSAALALAAWPLILLLYGAEFLPAVPMLWLLLPGVVSLAVGRLLSADLNGRGLPGVSARVNVVMALVNIALNAWWIPRFGAAGAAAATSVSYTAAVFLLGRRYRREADVAWSELLWLARDERRRLAARLFALARGSRAAGFPLKGRPS